MLYNVFIKHDKKIFLSKGYNYVFDMKTGQFARWGETSEEDPKWSTYGPELLDIEVSSGWCNGNCPWCYKGNTLSQEKLYMPLETYKKLFSKINVPTLTQIAFGITSIDANPDFFDIMKYTREHNIIPNYTTNGIGVTEQIAKDTANLCGAVAVSVYPHTETYAFNAIKRFLYNGMKQVNIHFMFAFETFEYAKKILSYMEHNVFVKGVHAVVFLQYKGKNPDSKYHSPTFEQFKEITDYALDKGINIGFDSCSSSMFMKAVAERPNAKELIQSVDNCESSLMSFYIDVNSFAYPCSFLEGVNEWTQGLDVLNCNNFVEDIWNNPKTITYREKLLQSSKSCKCEFSDSCRSCFIYDINKCKEEK